MTKIFKLAKEFADDITEQRIANAPKNAIFIKRIRKLPNEAHIFKVFSSI